MDYLDNLLYKVKLQGAEKTLKNMDVDTIEDHTIKVIARTILTACERLEEELVDKISSRDSAKTT